MKLPEDQSRLKGLLQETITLLCKNGLNYKAEFSVEALIVVTLDQEQMFHANIKETVAKEGINLSVEIDNEKELSSTPKSTGKSARKRRSQRDDSPEVPKKKSSSRMYSEEVSRDIPEDEGEEHSNTSYHNVKEENESSSECVLVKDELANRSSQDPVPLSDLEFVEGGGDQGGGLHYGAGVWNLQSDQEGASNLSGIEGDGSQEAMCAGIDRPMKYYSNSRTISTQNNIRFLCGLCATTFNHKHDLNRHVITVHEKQKWCCEVCFKCYSRKDYLKVHMKKAHSAT